MKPIKPKKMPEWLESDLKTYAGRGKDIILTPASTKHILAALAYERVRAEEWAKQAHEATQAVLRVATPALDKLKVKRQRAYPTGTNILTNDGRLVPLAEYQREQTAAVVPKARSKS